MGAQVCVRALEHRHRAHHRRTDKMPLLFALYVNYGESWSVLIRQMSYILFSQATSRPS